jgi:hypothetical protein
MSLNKSNFCIKTIVYIFKACWSFVPTSFLIDTKKLIFEVPNLLIGYCKRLQLEIVLNSPHLLHNFKMGPIS